MLDFTNGSFIIKSTGTDVALQGISVMPTSFSNPAEKAQCVHLVASPLSIDREVVLRHDRKDDALMSKFWEDFFAAATGRYGELQQRRREEQRMVATWSKYAPSFDRDTGTNQTNYFEGYVGARRQKRKVHIAIDEHHNVVFVRDIDGTVLYDRKNGIGTLPQDLNWSN